MTDEKKLRTIMKETGNDMEKLAEYLAISDCLLEKKLNGDREFSGYEIERLCSILCIAETKDRNQIFFAQNVDKTPTNYCIL